METKTKDIRTCTVFTALLHRHGTPKVKLDHKVPSTNAKHYVVAMGMRCLVWTIRKYVYKFDKDSV